MPLRFCVIIFLIQLKSMITTFCKFAKIIDTKSFNWFNTNFLNIFSYDYSSLKEFLSKSHCTYGYAVDNTWFVIIINIIRAVFKWLSKLITWLRLLRLVIGLKEGRTSFSTNKKQNQNQSHHVRVIFPALRASYRWLLGIDLFSLFILFSHFRPPDATRGNSFFQMSSYARANLRITNEKTKGKFPWGHHVVWNGKTKCTSWKGLLWLVHRAVRSCCDWWSNCFGFGFSTVIWKLLYYIFISIIIIIIIPNTCLFLWRQEWSWSVLVWLQND